MDLPEALAPPQLLPLARSAAPADGDILARIRARDESALLELYDRYNRLLFALALRVVGERETAEEVLQDVFVRVWEGSATFDTARGNVAAWLFGITRNRAVDVLRSRHHRARQREREPLPDQPRHDDGFDLAEWATNRETVRAALDALSPERRAVVELVYFAGMTHQEAALALGQPLGTTKGRIRAALDQLRAILVEGTR
ncbi:MAG: sigma-70 family RNA polymerase sigma factor [Dehalococcoidia bacterium]|nr:sigma-70 family RNA polymerase sigma factor [Dehalococcoidia bacterium]